MFTTRIHLLWNNAPPFQLAAYLFVYTGWGKASFRVIVMTTRTRLRQRNTWVPYRSRVIDCYLRMVVMIIGICIAICVYDILCGCICMMTTMEWCVTSERSFHGIHIDNRHTSTGSVNIKHMLHGPLARYVTLWVAYAPGMERCHHHRGLVTPTCITARVPRTCCDACRDR